MSGAVKRTQVEAELFEALERFQGRICTPEVADEMQEILMNYIRVKMGLPIPEFALEREKN